MDTTAATTGQQSTAPKRDMAQQMPWTAGFVERMRAQHGVAHVNDMLKRAAKGERNCFYTVEPDRREPNVLRTFGQPFDAMLKPDSVESQLIAQLLASGPGGGAGWCRPAVHTSAPVVGVPA